MVIQIQVNNLNDHHTMLTRSIFWWSFKLFVRSCQTSKNFEKKSQSPPSMRVRCLGMRPLGLSTPGSRGSPRFGRSWHMHQTDHMGQRWSFKSTIEIWMTIIPWWLSLIPWVVIQITELVIQIQICNLNDHHTMLIGSIFGVVIQIFGQILANL